MIFLTKKNCVTKGVSVKRNFLPKKADSTRLICVSDAARNENETDVSKKDCHRRRLL